MLHFALNEKTRREIMADKKSTEQKWTMDMTVKKIIDTESEDKFTARVLLRGSDTVNDVGVALDIIGPSDKVKQLLTALRVVKSGNLITMTLVNNQSTLADFDEKK
jgi:anti-anti-sigma regulatory factor